MREDRTLKKTSASSTEAVVETSAAVITTETENTTFAGLSSSLAEIRKLQGVVGYILRSDSAAVIDLADQDKIIPYAILASQISEATEVLAKHCGLAEVESTLVEGAAIKVLCMNLGDNRISVFMDKSATHAWIIKRILL